MRYVAILPRWVRELYWRPTYFLKWSGLNVTLLRISLCNHVSCMQLLDAGNIIPCFGVVCGSKLWPECSASNFVRFCEFLLAQMPNTVTFQNVYECTLDNGQCTTTHFHNRSTFVTNLWRINLWLAYPLQQGGSRDIVVGTQTITRVGPSGVWITGGTRDLLFSTTSRSALRPTQTLI